MRKILEVWFDRFVPSLALMLILRILGVFSHNPLVAALAAGTSMTIAKYAVKKSIAWALLLLPYVLLVNFLKDANVGILADCIMGFCSGFIVEASFPDSDL